MALSNAEKQARWRARHAAELRARKRRTTRPPKVPDEPEARVTWRVYELIDEQGLPRYVGCGRGWQALWDGRASSGSRLAAWFRALERPPMESSRWCLSVAVDAKTARQLAQARIRQIVLWAGRWPSWLLNEPPTNVPRAVKRVSADGVAERFASVKEAARATGIDRKTVQARLADGCRDHAGYAWFDDSDDGADSARGL